MKTVAAVFINDNNEILILKRSPHKRMYPNKWDLVAGKLEEGEEHDECLRREVAEEIGITDFDVHRGPGLFKYNDNGLAWERKWFVCKIKSGTIKLNKEHTEYKWLPIQEVLKLDCSMPLRKDLETV